MTVEEIKELIQVVNDSGIAELEVQRGENRVRIKRSHSPGTPEMMFSAQSPTVVSSAGSQTLLAVQPSGVSAGGRHLSGGAEEVDEASDLVYVKSPIVGTFYESPTPGAPAFVKVGDRVSAGQVLCIIESMKLMNEIEAEVAGVITSKLVENGRPVEYGESLFAVRPA